MLNIYEFSDDERVRRWQLVRRAMAERNLSALIIWGFAGYNSAECANFRYLSNIPTYGSLAYPGYLLFPAEGEPTAFGFAPMPGDKLWVKDIRGKSPKFSKAIINRLNELHLGGSNIGIVSLEAEAETGFPYSTYTALKEGLPKAQFEEAADILEDARRIKSEAEIRCFELGCEAANEAMKAVQETARPGVRDCEVVAKILEALTRYGCETDSLFLYGSGKEGVDAGKGSFINPRYLRKFEKGDMIHMEFDAKYNGYVAQHNQVFAVGTPDKDYLKVAEASIQACHAALKVLKAGITLQELNEAFQSTIKAAGLSSQRPAFHGLGLCSETPPLGGFGPTAACLPSNSYRLQAGMVLEFEPHAMTPDGKKHATIGCPVLVTETGCRPLNKSPLELKICGK